MPIITSTDRALSWTVIGAGEVLETGITQFAETTIAAEVNTLISDADENALLGALVTAGVTAPPLPEVGTELELGEIYEYNGTLLMVRKTHTRTEHEPATVPALFVVYRVDGGILTWVANEQVYVGTRRMYADVPYQCIQAHTTQYDWTPPSAGIIGVLWQVVVTTSEWSAGVAYTGDNTAGAGNGDVVTYNGVTYRCLQSHTSISTWTPSAVPALWKAVA